MLKMIIHFFILGNIIFSFSQFCNSKPAKEKIMLEDCRIKIQKLLAQDFSGWDGVPKDCAADSIKNIIPPRSLQEFIGFLGSQKLAYKYYLGEAPGYSTPIQVWHDQQKVLKIDLKFPDIVLEPDYFVTHFGEPESKSDYYFNQVLFKQSEWIYASRGIVLRLNGDLSKVIKISVFSSTSVGEYSNNLAEFEDYREFRD